MLIKDKIINLTITRSKEGRLFVKEKKKKEQRMSTLDMFKSNIHKHKDS